MDDQLLFEAASLCHEIRDNSLFAEALKRGPAAASEEVIEELRLRCPGHTREQYQVAIARGMFVTR